MSNSSMKPGKTLESTHYSSAYDKYKSYGKYFSTKHSNKYGNSSFWMDDIVDSRTEAESKFDILKMVQYQRAISNFVKIVAGKEIPVKFHGGDQSYSDGSTVVITANVNEKSFDVTAGLALHESSHILLTDYEFSKKIFPGSVSRSKYDLDTWHNIVKDSMKLFMEVNMPYLESKNFKAAITTDQIFALCNWIEDRRIDSAIFKMAPGYKSYYHSLYEKYYYNKDVTKLLKSKEFRTEDAESYFLRIKGLLNPASDPNALKGLRNCINMLDLHNIGRLNSTEDAVRLTLRIVDLIAQHIEPVESSRSQNNNSNPNSSNEQDENGDDMSAGDSDESNDMDDNMDDNSQGDSGQGDDSGKGDEDGGNDTDLDLPSLNMNELNKAKKAMEEIDKLVNGEIKKTKATKEVSRVVDTMAGSNEFNVDTVQYNGQNVPVVKLYLSDRVLRSGNYPLIRQFMDNEAIDSYFIPGKHYAMPSTRSWSNIQNQQKLIEAGLNLGTKLGRKLQVRDQVRDTKYTRLKSGKIDNRILYQAGYDAMNIFHHIDLDKYTPSVIDISIDASSSMSGTKWKNTQIAVLAIAKACSMIQNVRVKISYRYETALSSGRRAGDNLLLVDAYDSKRDKIGHLVNCVFAMRPINCTPDSLITKYQLNKKMITPGGPEMNSYFINFSDGGPGSSVGGYGGRSAHDHIRKCRKEIESLGVKVLSYYITESDRRSNDSSVIKQFKEDWGASNAKDISVTDVVALAKTMNEMFLSK